MVALEVPQRLTTEQAAAYLGVRRNTLDIWRLTGRHGLRFTKIGRNVRYDKADLDKWIKDRSGTSTSEVNQLQTA